MLTRRHELEHAMRKILKHDGPYGEPVDWEEYDRLKKELALEGESAHVDTPMVEEMVG